MPTVACLGMNLHLINLINFVHYAPEMGKDEGFYEDSSKLKLI